ncbi:MAG: hypothetical protein AAFO83_06855, partial [Cyanobacteria bacterium J06607_13]
MTYSPLPGTTPQNKSFTLSPAYPQESILRRVSCLLQCPIDTPQLWPQVLSVVGEALSCQTAQLWWSVPLVT